MKVFNLLCVQGHVFEGWFASTEDFGLQQARGLLQCPICGSLDVEKTLSAPRLNLGKSVPQKQPAEEDAATPSNRVASAPSRAAQEASHMLRAVYERMVQQVLASTVDVGEAFVEQARQMHAGELAEAPIRGKASAEEAQALRDEGIDIVALPVPAASRNRLQ